MTKYQPSIGQFAFGQPHQEFEVPEILSAALSFLRNEVGRVLWNLQQEECDPFGNRGEAFRCLSFGVYSYDWVSDGEQPYNFIYPTRDIRISWYKYLGRGESINRAINPEEVSVLLCDCLAAIRSVESGAEYQFGPLGTVPYFEEVSA